MKALILDGYVDEPARLGVPPYISPYPRYIAGLLRHLGMEWDYTTVDAWRERVKKGRDSSFFTGYDILISIFGAVVPGTYIRTRPMSVQEAAAIGQGFDGESYLLGPGVLGAYAMGDRYAPMLEDAYTRVLVGLPDVALARVFGLEARWSQFSVDGADVVKYAWKWPVAEIDTYIGCHRYASGGCSFCIEPTYGPPQVRQPDEVISEIIALYRNGVRHFRIGGQSCILSYGARIEDGLTLPDPEFLERFFRGIWETAPDIKVLHVDNVNPAVVSAPGGVEALEVLARYTTPGNVLAFGMESADPIVIEENNLNTSPEQVLHAVRETNRIGRVRGDNGMPHMLPGINILNGLKGESRETFRLNLDFLRGIVREGLWLRRIALRSVLPVRKGFVGARKWRRYDHDLRRFKEAVRKEIEGPLLEDMFPPVTILRDVLTEIHKSGGTIGRQLGSYPLAVYIPYQTDLNRFTDVVVTGHGIRSLIAIELGLDINKASLKALEAIPGIGRKRALSIARHRPFQSLDDLASIGFEKDLIESLEKLGVTAAGHSHRP